jgi:hypothetical protein
VGHGDAQAVHGQRAAGISEREINELDERLGHGRFYATA